MESTEKEAGSAQERIHGSHRKKIKIARRRNNFLQRALNPKGPFSLPVALGLGLVGLCFGVAGVQQFYTGEVDDLIPMLLTALFLGVGLRLVWIAVSRYKSK